MAGRETRLNADAKQGEIKVRISDAKRKVLDGFDYDDCVPINSDNLEQEVS